MRPGALVRGGTHLVWVCVLLRASSCQDPSTQDTADQSPYQDDIYSLRYENEAKPDHCRNDLCSAYFSYTPRKGEVLWPAIGVGFKRRMPCPYSVHDSHHNVFATDECVFVNSSSGVLRTVWTDPELGECPEPPLSELMKSIMTDVMTSVSETGSWQPDELWYERPLADPLEEMISVVPKDRVQGWFVGRVRDIMDTVRDYPKQKIFPDNLHHALAVCYGGVTVATPGSVTLDAIQDSMRCFDWLLSEPGLFSMETRHRIVWALTTLVSLIPTEFVDPPEMVGEVATLAVQPAVQHDDSGENVINKTFMAHNGEMTLQLSVGMNRDDDTTWKFLYVGYMRLWSYNEIELVDPPPYEISEHLDPLPPLEAHVAEKPLRSVGPMLFVNTGDKVRSEPSVQFTIALDGLSSNEHVIDSTVRCAVWHTPSTVTIEDYQEMTLEKCEDTELAYTENKVLHAHCTCSGVGYFGVFAAVDLTHTVIRPTELFMPDHEHGLDVFLGFPYIAELRVTSHVLRAISLVLLIVTLFSVVTFKRAHRGKPTRILTQLCIALIGLVVVLYISEGIASTRRGCQVSNILRYYFILVALLWNAVEALNMYLMLVKVFNIVVSHFVTKCAVVAWGVPALLVGIVLGVYHRNFDGIFTDECKFRCRLRPPVLQYALFLPMGVIFLHNIIVLGMVLKEIYRKDKPIVAKRSHWTTLCGVVSMMALLGLPWILSAFGAIDSKDEQSSVAVLEGVFHAVFLVTINLQGVFIFLFHCVRNADMRMVWKNTFAMSVTSSASRRTKAPDDTSVPDESLPLKHNRPRHGTIHDTVGTDVSTDTV